MSGIIVSMDVYGARELTVDLSQAGIFATARAATATAETAEEVARFARDTIRARTSGEYVKHYPNAITYEVSVLGAGIIAADIGPEFDKPQGGLGQLLEFGSRNNAPIPHLNPALDQSMHRYEDRLADALGEAFQ